MREMLNIIEIFILPLLIGIAIRLLFKKARLSWISTIAFTALALVWLAVYLFGSAYESAAFYMMMSIIATAGSAVTGVMLKLLNRKKVKENA